VLNGTLDESVSGTPLHFSREIDIIRRKVYFASYTQMLLKRLREFRLTLQGQGQCAVWRSPRVQWCLSRVSGGYIEGVQRVCRGCVDLHFRHAVGPLHDVVDGPHFVAHPLLQGSVEHGHYAVSRGANEAVLGPDAHDEPPLLLQRSRVEEGILKQGGVLSGR
jgi:hypothetical protein